MSNIIDILTIVDNQSLTNTIASKKIVPGTKSKPTSLGSYAQSDTYIYMITANAFVVNNQAKSELPIKANVKDSVRWMITCPGRGTSYNLILGKIKFIPPVFRAVILKLDLTIYTGGPDNPIQPYKLTDYCYQGIVTSKGIIQYTIAFQLLDNNGKNSGWFSWDPYIIVNI